MKNKVIKMLKVAVLSILINLGIVAVMVELWRFVWVYTDFRETFIPNLTMEIELAVLVVISAILAFIITRKLFKLKWPWLIPMIPMDYALAWAVMIARMILFPISW